MVIQKPFSLKESLQRFNGPSPSDFYDYLDLMKQDLTRAFEENDTRLHELNRKAVTGDKQATAYFLNEIEKYLRHKPFTGKLPEAYHSAAHGLFQEWKGFGPAYHWFFDRKYRMSTGLQIIGPRVFYNRKGHFQPFPYDMTSLDRVEQLKRSLLSNNPRLRLDHTNTSAELQMEDPLWPGRFIRIAIWVAPRVWDGFTTISLRRQVVDFLNLEDQAGTGSIPAESIAMQRNLFLTGLRTIIAGPVNSGKSTYANTIVGEQLSNTNECKGLVMIEKHPESIIPFVFPNHRIIPVMASNEELMDVGIESLRHDPQIVYMTEMRFHEWDFYLFAAAKGHDNLIGTYHTEDSEDIPYQAAQAIYTRIGGAMGGYLISALKACELVTIMEPTPDGKKKLTRLSELRFDEERKTILSNDLMRWDPDSKKWFYNDDVDPKLLQKMNRKNSIATKKFLSELTYLAGVRRIKDPIRESIKSRMVL